MVIDQGTRDLSTRVVPASPLAIPQHLPKLYLFAEKGPLGPTYIDFDQVSLTQVYGDATFDVNKKYYTHQTPFAQVIAANGNNVVIHRVAAPDAKDTANIALYLDVLSTQVPIYEKNSDGSIKLDSNGDKVIAKDQDNNDMTISGYKVMWVADHTVANLGEYQRGLLTQRPGVQVDGVTQSIQFPMFEFSADSPGEAGNKLAVKMYPALQSDLVPFPSNILNDGKLYPYYFGLVRIADEITGKTNVVLNSFGAQTARFVIENNGIDPTSGAVSDLKKVVTDQYIGLPPAQATGLGVVFQYQGNIDSVSQLLYDAEKNISDIHRDAVINNTDNNIHALNIFSFTSSNGSPYKALQLVDEANSVRLTRNTNIFLDGSTDGTITEDLLDSLLIVDMENYDNSLHEYNDLVIHPESIIYDSGFGLEAKKSMSKFISRRKDTVVVLSTLAHNAPASSLAEQFSVAIALKTMLELFPESATFGTPVMRGVVMGGGGTIINSLYIKKVPTAYELAFMASRYMGAKNGAWRNGFSFDRAPLSIISRIKDIDVTWVPASTRNTLWSVGLNFALNYEIRRQFFPALQTVYDNDTSVLNSFFTVMAIAYINKIKHAAWREFSGSISLTDAQLEEQVNNFVSAAVKDKFDGKYVIIPDTTVTELDALRGYSWTLPVKIYANNMKTVMITSTEAFRMSDLLQP